MNRFGIGLQFGGWSVAAAAALAAVQFVLGDRLVVSQDWSGTVWRWGLGMFAAGVLVYIAAMAYLVSAMRHGRLATRGPYAVVRHPDYCAGVYLMGPGFALMYGSWLMLVLPFVMGLVVRGLIDREEAALAEQFGREYCAYQQRVGRLFPRIRRGASSEAEVT